MSCDLLQARRVQGGQWGDDVLGEAVGQGALDQADGWRGGDRRGEGQAVNRVVLEVVDEGESLAREALAAGGEGGSFPAVPVQGGKVLDEAVEVAESGERRREEAAEVGAVLGIGVFEGLLDEAPYQRGIDLGQCGSAAAGDDLGGDVRVTSLPVLRNTVRVPGGPSAVLLRSMSTVQLDASTPL
ncbi:hypothetical protein [Streptomyces aureus]|uniref:hypothetical protein n=1 Tax=Streptomyces aureus TaxID=193461 RepID=UPI0036423EC3